MYLLLVVKLFFIHFDINLYHAFNMTKGYRQIAIPEPLYEQVKRFLEKHTEYTSMADLVKELLRKELKNNEIKKS